MNEKPTHTIKFTTEEILYFGGFLSMVSENLSTKNKSAEEKKTLNYILSPIGRILTYRNSLLEVGKEIESNMEKTDGEKGNTAGQEGAESSV